MQANGGVDVLRGPEAGPVGGLPNSHRQDAVWAQLVASACKPHLS